MPSSARAPFLLLIPPLLFASLQWRGLDHEFLWVDLGPTLTPVTPLLATCCWYPPRMGWPTRFVLANDRYNRPFEDVILPVRRLDLARLEPFVVKHHELRRFQREQRVRPAVVVTEFDFEDVRGEQLHNGADLTAHQATFWQLVR